MRLRYGLILMVLVSPVGLAETIQDKLINCSKNSDSLQRLVCYDNLAKTLEAKEQPITPHQANNVSAKNPEEPENSVKPVVAKAPPIKPTKIKVAQQPTKKSGVQDEVATAKFGRENKQTPVEQIDQIHAKVSKVDKTAYGKHIITLENQQVWRQTDNIHMKIKQGQMVSIERGLMGSFFMSTEKVNKRIRVKRVH